MYEVVIIITGEVVFEDETHFECEEWIEDNYGIEGYNVYEIKYRFEE